MSVDDEKYQVAFLDEDGVERYTAVLPYAKANERAEVIRLGGMEIIGVMTVEHARERRNNPDADIVHPDPELLPEPSADHVTLFEGEVEQAEASKRAAAEADIRRALERAEKILLDAEEQARSRCTVAERSEEPRRYQALEMALRLMEQKGFPTIGERARATTAENLVKDAKVIEKYLKGTTRSTKA